MQLDIHDEYYNVLVKVLHSLSLGNILLDVLIGYIFLQST